MVNELKDAHRRVEKVSRLTMRMVSIGAISALLLAVVTFGLAAVGAVQYAVNALSGPAHAGLPELLWVLDEIVLATTLVIVAFGLWELFVSDLHLPAWLEVHNLTQLKTKVVETLVLALAIKFIERFVRGGDPLTILYEAVAVTLVGALLTAFATVRSKP